MITAKEARKLTPDLKTLQEKELEYVEEKIKSAIRLGSSDTSVVIMNQLVKNMIVVELLELGYKTKSLSDIELRVEW